MFTNNNYKEIGKIKSWFKRILLNPTTNSNTTRLSKTLNLNNKNLTGKKDLSNTIKKELLANKEEKENIKII